MAKELELAKKLAVRQADLAVREPFPLTPCDVLGNGARLLLSQRGHDGDEQFTFGVQRENVFFLEENLNAFFLQLADGDKCISSLF